MPVVLDGTVFCNGNAKPINALHNNSVCGAYLLCAPQNWSVGGNKRPDQLLERVELIVVHPMSGAGDGRELGVVEMP